MLWCLARTRRRAALDHPADRRAALGRGARALPGSSRGAISPTRTGPIRVPGGDRRIRTSTWSALAPLALPDLPEEIGRRLVEEHLLDQRKYWLPFPPTSVSVEEPTFEPRKWKGPLRRLYWRGPTWINSAWLIWMGLLRLGYDAEAMEMAKRLCERRGGAAPARVLRAVLRRGPRRQGVRLVLADRRARGSGPGGRRVVSANRALLAGLLRTGTGAGVETPALQTNFPAVSLRALTRTELVPAGRPFGRSPEIEPVPVRVRGRAVERRDHGPGRVEQLEPYPARDPTCLDGVERSLRRSPCRCC